MSQLNIEKINKVHFIGVGGIGVSALARHLLTEKKTVSGSDRTLGPITKRLSAEGVQIFGEQIADNITKDIDLIVYTEAMRKDQEEMRAAKKSGIPMMNYFEALSLAMNPYYLIAVAGTHGKTTTTAMITDIFEVAEKDPTAVIGSLRAKTKSNYRSGKSKYAIVEACEFKKDFLYLRPEILVITNIEHEHVDYYADLAEVQKAFRKLARQVLESGVVIADTSDPNLKPVIEGLEVPVVNYLDFLDINLELKQPGMHNRLNASAALAVAKKEQIDIEEAKETLREFTGTWRRFEYKGDINGGAIYDDYAHHPTEIMATIGSARELYPERTLTIVFQPHTYTRTKEFFDDFARALGLADKVIILPVYAAREENVSGITSRELSVKTLEFNKNVEYAESFTDAEEILKEKISDNDVVVVMGAGDVTELAGNLVK